MTAQGLAVRSRAKNRDGEEKEGGADLWSLDEEWTSWPAKWAATSNYNQNADAGGTRDVASNDPSNDVPTSSNGPEKASNEEEAEVHSEQDPADEPGLARVLGEWKAAFGIGRTITIDELIGVDHKGLKAALLVVAAMDDGLTVSNIRLARWLRDFNEVSVNRLLLRYGGVNSEGSQLWTLQDAAHALT